jgi:hypothetical protein
MSTAFDSLDQASRLMTDATAVVEQKLNRRRRNAQFLQIVARLTIRKGLSNRQNRRSPGFRSRCPERLGKMSRSDLSCGLFGSLANPFAV